MFSSHWTTLTVRKFKRFAVQNSVWIKAKSWNSPVWTKCSVKYFSRSKIRSVVWNTYTLGDMSLQHFAAINHSVRTGRAISYCNKLRDTSQWQIAWCVLRLVNSCANLCLSNRILSPQQVAQIQSDLIFCDLLPRQNYVAETKIFTKILQYTQNDLSQRRVAARNVLQELVAWCVPTLMTINEK